MSKKRRPQVESNDVSLERQFQSNSAQHQHGAESNLSKHQPHLQPLTHYQQLQNYNQQEGEFFD